MDRRRLELAERSRAVNGLWVGIWHPNLTPALGFPGAPAAYARLVIGLRERGAWIAPLGELVRVAPRTPRTTRARDQRRRSANLRRRRHGRAGVVLSGQPLEAHVGR